MYTPKTADEWKGLIASAVRPFLPSEPYEGPVKIEHAFLFPRPKSHLKKSGGLTSSAPLHHVSKPDLDNLVKAVWDTLTSEGFWRDDSQIVSETTTKAYAESGEPGVVITISRP
jgi:Holliday junction resolvase RusA-like endonuclease